MNSQTHNPGCTMLSVSDMLNLACYEVVGRLDLAPVLGNHQRAIALITDHQIDAFAKGKDKSIEAEPPYIQRQMREHFKQLPERLRAWRDRAKLAVN